MDLVRIADLGFSFQHQHEDGSWGRFEATGEHHDPSEHDPEREWGTGTVYRCTTCDEEIVVTRPDEPAEPRV